MPLAMPSPRRTALSGVRLFQRAGLSRPDARQAVADCCDAAEKRIAALSPQDVTWLREVKRIALGIAADNTIEGG